MSLGSSRGKLRDTLKPRAGEHEAGARYKGRSRGGDLRLPAGPHKPEPNIVQFRAREIAAAVKSSCDEHLAVGQQRRRVKESCGAEAAGGTPAGLIVQFRARENVVVGVSSSYDQHLAIGQQRRCVSLACSPQGVWRSSRSRWPDRTIPRSREPRRCRYNRLRRAPCRWAATSPCRAWGVEVASGTPGSRLAGLYSCALPRLAAGALSSCDQHLTVGQQRRRVNIACGAEAAGGTPGPGGRRIVQFRAREIAAGALSSCDQHLAVGQQRCRVIIACGAEAAGGTSRSRWPDRTVPRSRDSLRRYNPPATSTLPLGSNVAV